MHSTEHQQSFTERNFLTENLFEPIRRSGEHQDGAGMQRLGNGWVSNICGSSQPFLVLFENLVDSAQVLVLFRFDVEV
jgi:hypothetical protein